MVPVQLLDLFGTLSKQQSDATKMWISHSLELNKLLANYRKGPKAREVLQARNREIDKAMQVGITDPDDIHRFMVEHHPALMRQSKRRGASFISVQSMMKRHKAGRE